MKNKSQSRWMMTALALATSGAFAQQTDSVFQWGQWLIAPGTNPEVDPTRAFRLFSQSTGAFGNNGRDQDTRRAAPGTHQLDPIKFPPIPERTSSAPWAATGDWTGYASSNVASYGSDASSGTVSLTLRPTNIQGTYGYYGGTATLSASVGPQAGGLGANGSASFSGNNASFGIFRQSGYAYFGATWPNEFALNGGSSAYGTVQTSAPPPLTAPSDQSQADINKMWAIGNFTVTSALSPFSNFSFVAGQPSVTADMTSLRNSSTLANYQGLGSAGHFVGISVNFGNATWTGNWNGAPPITIFLGGAGTSFSAAGTISGANIASTSVTGLGIASGTVAGTFVGPMAAGLIGRTDLTINTPFSAKFSSTFATIRCGGPNCVD